MEQAVGQPNAVERVIALVLVIGGVVGVGLGVWLAVQSLRQPLVIVFSVLLVLVFLWCVLKGIDLWRGKPSGYRWAKILFGAQIPNIAIPGLQYEFYTTVSVLLAFGDVKNNLSFSLGSALRLYILPESTGLAIGVNLIAIAALAYLLARKR